MVRGHVMEGATVTIDIDAELHYVCKVDNPQHEQPRLAD